MQANMHAPPAIEKTMPKNTFTTDAAVDCTGRGVSVTTRIGAGDAIEAGCTVNAGGNAGGTG